MVREEAEKLDHEESFWKRVEGEEEEEGEGEVKEKRFV